MYFKEVWKFARRLDPKNIREWEDYCDDKFLNKLKKEYFYESQTILFKIRLGWR
jgi:hypothetical protein